MIVATCVMLGACGRFNVKEPKPVGDWRSLATGQEGTVKWEVFQADATDDGTCLTVEFDPVLSAEQSAGLIYRGKPFGCPVLPDKATHFRDPSPVWGDPSLDPSFLLGVMPQRVRKAEVTFSDGTSAASRIDASSGVFFFLYPRDAHPSSVVFESSDASTMSCGLSYSDGIAQFDCSP